MRSTVLLAPSASVAVMRSVYRPGLRRFKEIYGLPTGRPAALQPFRPSSMTLTSV